MTPGLGKDIQCHIWPYLQIHTWPNLQITRSYIRSHIKWSVCLVIAYDHFNLPRGLVWVCIVLRSIIFLDILPTSEWYMSLSWEHLHWPSPPHPGTHPRWGDVGSVENVASVATHEHNNTKYLTTQSNDYVWQEDYLHHPRWIRQRFLWNHSVSFQAIYKTALTIYTIWLKGLRKCYIFVTQDSFKHFTFCAPLNLL